VSAMPRLLFLSLAVMIAAAASAQMVNETRPFSGTIANPCNGENVVFSGTIHFHEKTQTASDGRIHFVANNNFNASGTGQNSGRSYSVGGNMHNNSKFPSFPIVIRQRTKVVSSGSGDNFHITFSFHVNGNGQQTHVTNESDCNG
jgi:hypothetical protein